MFFFISPIFDTPFNPHQSSDVLAYHPSPIVDDFFILLFLCKIGVVHQNNGVNGILAYYTLMALGWGDKGSTFPHLALSLGL